MCKLGSAKKPFLNSVISHSTPPRCRISVIIHLANFCISRDESAAHLTMLRKHAAPWTRYDPSLCHTVALVRLHFNHIPEFIEIESNLCHPSLAVCLQFDRVISNGSPPYRVIVKRGIRGPSQLHLTLSCLQQVLVYKGALDSLSVDPFNCWLTS